MILIDKPPMSMVMVEPVSLIPLVSALSQNQQDMSLTGRSDPGLWSVNPADLSLRLTVQWEPLQVNS